MKRLIVVALVIVILTGFTALHIVRINKFSTEALEISGRIQEELLKDNWDEIGGLINRLGDVWYKNRLWAGVTLRTDIIDEIEISLAQCKKYAEIRAKENFTGELQMFSMLVEHLPKQEGAALGELL